MVTPGRLELPTRSLGNCCSIHLSYGATRFAGQVATLILLGFARGSFRKLLVETKNSNDHQDGAAPCSPGRLFRFEQFLILICLLKDEESLFLVSLIGD